jgi:hypothetical protein
MYKKCSKCKEEKLFSEFARRKTSKDGRDSHCKYCVNHYHKSNKQHISEYNKQYKEANKEQIAEYSKEYGKHYYELNKDQISEQHRQYKKFNRFKFNALNAKRKARKLQATPNWLTSEELDQIEEFYKEAQTLKSVTGKQYHVDHIVPLQGKSVCGLHVPWNLQILEASENIRKSNKLL